MFYENYLTSAFHTNTVISRRVRLLVKMALKTVIRPITNIPKDPPPPPSSTHPLPTRCHNSTFLSAPVLPTPGSSCKRITCVSFAIKMLCTELQLPRLLLQVLQLLFSIYSFSKFLVINPAGHAVPKNGLKHPKCNHIRLRSTIIRRLTEVKKSCRDTLLLQTCLPPAVMQHDNHRWQ